MSFDKDAFRDQCKLAFAHLSQRERDDFCHYIQWGVERRIGNPLMFDLPVSAFDHLMHFLTFKDRTNMSSTCRTWNQLVKLHFSEIEGIESDEKYGLRQDEEFHSSINWLSIEDEDIRHAIKYCPNVRHVRICCSIDTYIEMEEDKELLSRIITLDAPYARLNQEHISALTSLKVLRCRELDLSHEQLTSLISRLDSLRVRKEYETCAVIPVGLTYARLDPEAPESDDEEDNDENNNEQERNRPLNLTVFPSAALLTHLHMEVNGFNSVLIFPVSFPNLVCFKVAFGDFTPRHQEMLIQLLRRCPIVKKLGLSYDSSGDWTPNLCLALRGITELTTPYEAENTRKNMKKFAIDSNVKSLRFINVTDATREVIASLSCLKGLQSVRLTCVSYFSRSEVEELTDGLFSKIATLRSLHLVDVDHHRSRAYESAICNPRLVDLKKKFGLRCKFWPEARQLLFQKDRRQEICSPEIVSSIFRLFDNICNQSTEVGRSVWDLLIVVSNLSHRC